MFSLAAFSLSCCINKDTSATSPPIPENRSIPVYANVEISTNKAMYHPGDEISFKIDYSKLPSSAKVRYKYLNETLSEVPVTGSTWKWVAPATDHRGYLAEVYSASDETETIYSTIAVDVSSDWKKFPRYGFLSNFPKMRDGEIKEIISSLNRFHINGLQFYDWQNKHHKPLPLVESFPADSWKDIINRDIFFTTVQKYISTAHDYNMKAMFYNLAYGAWENAEADGVQKEWYVYNDITHTNRDFHLLQSPFLSNIFLLDPSNPGWQQYLIYENRKIYQFLNFDGFHVDQLGDRGIRYTFDGNFLNLSQSFRPFIEAVKAASPQKDIVMNAVSQYGQKGIAEASTAFLYSEVWSPFDSYSDLANLIQQNYTYSNNTKNSVLAAYMNYDLANNQGYFNSPSVLMTDAVIFANGGAHLELGEHMLGKEYFPNNNLRMKDDLKNSLINYYDFLVGYENLLRDGGSPYNINISSTDNKLSLTAWPGYQGAVAFIGRKFGNFLVAHLINFTNSVSQNWRDSKGIQVTPATIRNAGILLSTDISIKKIWLASPDFAGGASLSLNFVQTGNKINFVLPELLYWDMIVFEVS